MSKWIDADEIENAKFQEENLRGMGEHIAYRVGWNEAIEAILENAPSIEIIRCRECKWLRYCETEDLNIFLDCDHPDGGGIPRNEEWFCADGEREGE